MGSNEVIASIQVAWLGLCGKRMGPNPGHTLAVWNLEAIGKGSSWEEPLAE